VKTQPKNDYRPDGGEFAGRVGKYDVWVVQSGILVTWKISDCVDNGSMLSSSMSNERGTIHSWEQWKAGKLRHWPPGLTRRINAMRGLLGYV